VLGEGVDVAPAAGLLEPELLERVLRRLAVADRVVEERASDLHAALGLLAGPVQGFVAFDAVEPARPEVLEELLERALVDFPRRVFGPARSGAVEDVEPAGRELLDGPCGLAALLALDAFFGFEVRASASFSREPT
jgi:hypothetical protein